MNDKQRIVFLNWLRAAACLMVFLVHACECVYSNDYSFSIPSETARWTIGLIQGFVRPIAVPLFLMASAYLLVPVTRSTGDFLLFKCIKTPGRSYGLVKKVSQASYGMYLMHMLMLPAIFGLMNGFMPVPLAIISTALLTYICSCILSLLIGRLPFGKYIVG